MSVPASPRNPTQRVYPVFFFLRVSHQLLWYCSKSFVEYCITSAMSNQSAIDSMVFESFMKGAETVILERKAILQPMTTSSSSDCAEYIRQTVNSWKRQLSRPMNIDLYIFNNATNGHVLMERWNFTYTNSPDSSELGSTATINQRIQTLLRGLYSFLRLLPGFNLLRCSPVKPLITVQIYDPKISPEAFRYESSNYNFPTISTSKGQLSLSVAFTNPAIVKVFSPRIPK